MSWLAVSDWAEEMGDKLHQQRLRVAAEHFGLDLRDVIGDDGREKDLLARYEATGLSWPPFDEDEDD